MSTKMEILKEEVEKALCEIREDAIKETESLCKESKRALFEAKTNKEIDRIQKEFKRSLKEIEKRQLEKTRKVQRGFLEAFRNF